MQHAKTVKEYCRATDDDYAYGSSKSVVSFTDLGSDHTFMMTKNSTGSKKKYKWINYGRIDRLHRKQGTNTKEWMHCYF